MNASAGVTSRGWPNSYKRRFVQRFGIIYVVWMILGLLIEVDSQMDAEDFGLGGLFLSTFIVSFLCALMTTAVVAVFADRAKVAKGVGWGLAGLVAVGMVGDIAGGPDAEAAEPSRMTVAAEPTQEPTTQQPAEEPTSADADVVGIVDGDTLSTSAGNVRIIGIDTPETGVCGYAEASANLAKLLPVGSTVALTGAGGKDDHDTYGRLLRYVATPSGLDVGMQQIKAGLAIARYDSRDGYGAHPQEDAYIAADTAAADFTCETPTATPVAPTTAPKATAKAKPKVATKPKSKPAAPKAPAAVSYANCAAARAAGAAPLHRGDPGYAPKLDRDKDGVACE